MGRKAPPVVRVNQVLRTSLIAFCGLAILGYGLDVARTNGRNSFARTSQTFVGTKFRIVCAAFESNLLEGIQDSVVGRHGLQVPEHVLVVKEVAAPKLTAFRANKHSLPLLSGY